MTRRTLAAFIAAVLLGAPAAAHADPVAQASATCSDYSTQADAQRAADTRDADGDGIYCESLPCPCLGPGGGGGGGGGDDSPPPPRPRQQAIAARIRRVIDGDTIEVRAIGAARKTYKVRLIGIDTPEVYGGLECGARDASAYMERIAWPGRRVTLRTDPTQDLFDRYGRLLAYVDTSRGSLQSKMLTTGWAKVYVYGGKPFQRVDGFRKSASQAKRQGRGVWGQCNGNFHRRVRGSSTSSLDERNEAAAHEAQREADEAAADAAERESRWQAR